MTGSDVPVDPSTLRRFDRNFLDAGQRLAPRVLEPVPYCWFCDSDSGGRSREHIFPQGLLIHFDAMDERVQPYRASMATGALLSERGERPLRAHVNGEVCRRCNNGWISTLDAAAQAILTRRPLRGRITEEEAGVLARWFAKVAVNLNVTQPYRLLVPASSRHGLAKGVPDQFAVHLFRVRRQNGVFDWVQKSPDTGFVPSGRVAEFQRLTALTLVTHIRVAHVVAVVVHVPEPLRSTEVVPDGAARIYPLPERLPTWGGLPRHNDYWGALTHWNMDDATP